MLCLSHQFWHGWAEAPGQAHLQARLTRRAAAQAMPGVPALRQGVNPATWMLEVSTPAAEQRLGLDFADAYRKSELFTCAARCAPQASCSRGRDAELDRAAGHGAQR